MSWRIGDFGRFKIESPKYPRFEVISSDKQKGEVTVWYSGRAEPTVIPRETFLEDCVNWWHLDKVVREDEIPKWLIEGCQFTLQANTRALNIILTEFKEDYRTTTSSYDVNHMRLTFRRRRLNYLSCEVEATKVLLLVPVQEVLVNGKSTRSRWDMIRKRDILDPEEEDL